MKRQVKRRKPPVVPGGPKSIVAQIGMWLERTRKIAFYNRTGAPTKRRGKRRIREYR